MRKKNFPSDEHSFCLKIKTKERGKMVVKCTEPLLAAYVSRLATFFNFFDTFLEAFCFFLQCFANASWRKAK